MRISRLRLLGFKSFVEPTELIIEPGLTGVVGPNGCGKSNLLEALRWVMGETSHKSMRAAAMDDVIFSGTSERPARNMAEVAIFLDNSERLAPAEYNDSDEIEIARRIEREAGSVYRINGKESRARDVKILFEDASTGARSPSLVRQGQIGDIVNAKPEARRRILEDAAGTAGLHSRRHEAELRLRAAENNLARLNDVIGGLNAQVESLKRQARQAKRYKGLSGDIRRAEALLLHLVWVSAQNDAQNYENGLSEILVTLGEAARAESQALGAETKLAETLKPLREDEATRSAILGRLQIENENFEREAERANQRASELQARAEQLTRDLAREEDFTTESDEIITRIATDIERLAKAEAGEQRETEAAATAREDADKVLAETEGRISGLTANLAEKRAERQSLERRFNEAEQAVARQEQRIAELERQATAITAKAPDAAKLSALVADNERLLADITTSETRTSKAEKQVVELSQKLKAERDAASEARLAANSLRTERETLAKLLLPNNADGIAAIVDAVQVSPGYEAALGASLGDDLEATADEASAVHWRVLEPQSDDPVLPSDIEPLIRYVDAPPELARRLRQIGIVEREDGPRLQRHLRPGQRLVSKSGDLWRWDGFIAASEGTTAAARRLEQRNRLSAVEQEGRAAIAAAEKLSKAELKTADRLAKAQDEERDARTLWRQQQSALTQSRQQRDAIEKAARETESRMAEVNGARTRANEDLAEAERNRNDVAAAREREDDEALQRLESELEAERAKSLEQRSDAAEKRAAEAGLVRARQEREARLAEARREHENWLKRQSDAHVQIKALKVRHEETRKELEEYADLPAKLEKRRQELLTSLTAAERDRKAAADRLAEAENKLNETNKELRAVQSRLGEAKEARARIEAQLEAAQERLKEAEHRITETLNVKPDDCLSLAELPDGATPPDLAEVDRRLTRLKADRERLGGVNLQADDDLVRIGEEVAAIETERADVDEAIAKLRGAIQQLNREGRKRLREAFETVDQHFQRLFSKLFGGGEARLEMIESAEDPLEGGLEIIARPPGKKPATLSLLSGGEQTLTALSLIFAVFLTNPSPICVLDEVDAPLDDANVERFCTLMEAMSGETATRFLVITHHPMTMTRMNRLFGVTMAERGVSQLVSVDLETAQSFREAS